MYMQEREKNSKTKEEPKGLKLEKVRTGITIAALTGCAVFAVAGAAEAVYRT